MKGVPFVHRVQDVIAAADQAAGITGREVAERMGMSKHADILRVQQACCDGVRRNRVTAINAAYPARYIVTREYQPPEQRAAAAKARSAAEKQQREARARSHARRMQAALDKQARAAAARKPAVKPASPRKPAAPPPHETTEQFIARGGNYQVLPHNFDTRPTSFPGRRPVNNHNQRGRSQP